MESGKRGFLETYRDLRLKGDRDALYAKAQQALIVLGEYPEE